MNIKYITLTIITFTGAIGWGAATHQDACLKSLAGKRLSKNEIQLLSIAKRGKCGELCGLQGRQQSLNMNVTDEYGDTPLMIAAAQGHCDIMEILLDCNANIEYGNSQIRGTALTYACHYGHVEAVQLLIDREANVNAVDCNGDTVLMYAARANHLEIINMLLTNGANVRQTNKSNQTASAVANLKDRHDAEALLLKWENNRNLILAELKNKKRCEAKRKHDDDDADEPDAKRSRRSDGSMAYDARNLQVTRPAIETVIENLNQQLADDMPYIETLINEYSFYGFEQCSHNRIRINYNHIFSMGLRYEDVDGFQNVLVGIDGFHHDYLQTMENSGCFEFLRQNENVHGCYVATLHKHGCPIKKISFFPAHWSRKEVIEAILEAYKNFKENNKDQIPLINSKYKITGFTSMGIPIQMLVTTNGLLITAYPLLS